LNCLGGIAVEEDLVVVEIDDSVTEFFDLAEAVGDKDGGDIFGD